VPPELDRAGFARICTLPCGGASGDAGTDAQVLEAASQGATDVPGDALCASGTMGGYCGVGFCRTQRITGEVCSRSAECVSHNCDVLKGACLGPSPAPAAP
jgi:hypothetical protein